MEELAGSTGEGVVFIAPAGSSPVGELRKEEQCKTERNKDQFNFPFLSLKMTKKRR